MSASALVLPQSTRVRIRQVLLLPIVCLIRTELRAPRLAERDTKRLEYQTSLDARIQLWSSKQLLRTCSQKRTLRAVGAPKALCSLWAMRGVSSADNDGDVRHFCAVQGSVPVKLHDDFVCLWPPRYLDEHEPLCTHDVGKVPLCRTSGRRVASHAIFADDQRERLPFEVARPRTLRSVWQDLAL